MKKNKVKKAREISRGAKKSFSTARKYWTNKGAT